MMGVILKQLRAAYAAYQQGEDVIKLLEQVEGLGKGEVEDTKETYRGQRLLTKEDLHLVCWEYVWS